MSEDIQPSGCRANQLASPHPERRTARRRAWVLAVGLPLLGCGARAGVPVALPVEPVPPAVIPPDVAPPLVLDGDTAQRRFPVDEAQARRAEAERRELQAMRRRQLLASPSVGTCRGLTAEESISCPLQTFGVVDEIVDIPGGVRISYAAGSVQVEHMRRLVACQAGLARVEPSAPPFCPFFDARTEKTVRQIEGHTVVDITDPVAAGASMLRQRVRVAFSEAAGPTAP